MSICDGCNRGLPVQNGIHMGEVEMLSCTAKTSELSLVPMHSGSTEGRVTWHQPAKRKIQPGAFICGSSA